MQDDTSRTDIRAPKQHRSRKRVDLILNAARMVIAERGSAGVTIKEIAERAGITAGSMYQYFPNKAAIIEALGIRYREAFSERLAAEMARTPQSADDMARAFEALIDADYRTGLEEPAIRDIWQALATDQTLRDVFTVENHRNVADLTQAALPLVRRTEREQLPLTISLMFHLADSAIRMALEQPEAEGRRIIARAKAMLRVIWFAMV